jgi:hypothetical protein
MPSEASLSILGVIAGTVQPSTPVVLYPMSSKVRITIFKGDLLIFLLHPKTTKIKTEIKNNLMPKFIIFLIFILFLVGFVGISRLALVSTKLAVLSSRKSSVFFHALNLDGNIKKISSGVNKYLSACCFVRILNLV